MKAWIDGECSKPYLWMYQTIFLYLNVLITCKWFLFTRFCNAINIRTWTPSYNFRVSPDHRTHKIRNLFQSPHGSRNVQKRHTNHIIKCPPKVCAQTFSAATEAFSEQNGRGFNWDFDHYRITMWLLGTLVIVSWINHFHSTNCGIHTANQCAACLT